MIRSLLSSDSIIAKLLRFGLIGGVSTLFYGACSWCLVYLATSPPVLASIIAYLLAIPLNFVMQRRFAFRSAGVVRIELPKFLVVHGISLTASAMTMYLTVDSFDLSPIIGVLITMVLVPVLSFTIMNFWVFPHSSTGESK